MTTLTLIGAPTDVGASVLGASMGPDALRIAGIARAMQARGFDVRDQGNLAGPGNPQAEPASGFRHLAEVAAWNRAVYEATHAAQHSDRRHRQHAPQRVLHRQDVLARQQHGPPGPAGAACI